MTRRPARRLFFAERERDNTSQREAHTHRNAMISRERFYPLKERNEWVKRKRRRRRNEDGSRALSLLAGTRALFARSRARQSKTQRERAREYPHFIHFFSGFHAYKKGRKKKEILTRALGKLEKRRSREHRNARETSRSRQCRRELSVPLSFFCRFLNRPNKRARGRRCRRCRRRRRSRFEREEKKRKKFGRRTGIGSANAKRRSRRSDSFVRGRHRGR